MPVNKATPHALAEQTRLMQEELALQESSDEEHKKKGPHVLAMPGNSGAKDRKKAEDDQWYLSGNDEMFRQMYFTGKAFENESGEPLKDMPKSLHECTDVQKEQVAKNLQDNFRVQVREQLREANKDLPESEKKTEDQIKAIVDQCNVQVQSDHPKFGLVTMYSFPEGVDGIAAVKGVYNDAGMGLGATQKEAEADLASLKKEGLDCDSVLAEDQKSNKSPASWTECRQSPDAPCPDGVYSESIEMAEMNKMAVDPQMLGGENPEDGPDDGSMHSWQNRL